MIRNSIINLNKFYLNNIKMPSMPENITTENIKWFKAVNSTMDNSREYLKSKGGKIESVHAIVADDQLKGRGTHGRTWLNGHKNLFVTFLVPIPLIKNLNIPLHLTPLRVGTLIHSCLLQVLPSNANITLKWPNDVLVDGKKICGTLIEMDGDVLLIGTGCNITTAPEINPVSGRESTCILDYNSNMKRIYSEYYEKLLEERNNDEPELDTIGSHTTTIYPYDFNKKFVLALYDKYTEWLSNPDSAEQIIDDFSKLMNYDDQKLRDHPNKDQDIVIPTKLNKDGTLTVRFKHNNEEKLLVSEYLW